MTFVSLFAGIGGIDLGLERAGHTCVGQVELDPYARRVLAKHWPDVPKHDDVKTFRGDEFGPFDLLAGGYPCQPFSHAGRRNGERDPRHLWPEVHRILRHVRPRYVLLENVPGHLSLGFGRVLGDLAESGFDAEWSVVSACSVGAPHLRRRLFILAYARGERPGALPGGASRDEGADEGRATDEDHVSVGPAAAVGRSTQWRSEPEVGRMADGIPRRLVRNENRALGNAVVPQVAEWIGSRLPA